MGWILRVRCHTWVRSNRNLVTFLRMQKKKCRLLSYFFVFVFFKKLVLSTQKKAKKSSFYRLHWHGKKNKTNYLHFPFCIKNVCLQLFFCFVFFCSCFSIWKDVQFFFVVFVLNSFGLPFFFVGFRRSEIFFILEGQPFTTQWKICSLFFLVMTFVPNFFLQIVELCCC